MAENSQNNDESVDRYDVSVHLLGKKTTTFLSSFLNPVKVIPTESNIPRYWQGLAELVGIGGEHMPHLQTIPDPTLKVLQLWHENDRQNSTIRTLLNHLEILDRFDIVDDIKPLLDEDVQYVKENISNGEANVCSLESDRDVLTVDDWKRINEGSTPQTYDAYVLYSDEDIKFASELIETMEKKSLKFCVKDRDLMGGTFEHEAIIRLITERCNRLIVIFSPAFFKSAANKFFVNVAQAIGIEQRERKIIPCIYTYCDIPMELKCYFMLDYNRTGQFWNFWDRLYTSIRTPERAQVSDAECKTGQDVPKKTNLNRSVSHQVRSNMKTNCLKPTVNFVSNTLKPKKEGVSFSSMVNLSDTSIEPQLNPSTSLNTVSLGEKKTKPKTNWLKKLLHTKNQKHLTENNMQEKEKKKFWHRHSKQKVAVAN